MAIYIVGDLQGCLTELHALLEQVQFNQSKDQLWLVGDLVARGPDSLATLRFIKSLGKSAKVVLGNHDLHLLATYAGIKKVKPKDLLDDLLAAPDIDELMHWLAKQPLIRKLPNEASYMSHAGIPPQWSIKKAVKYAKKARKKLNSPERHYWLTHMYGDETNNWQFAETKLEKFRFTINALTRMRYCHENLSLDFKCKDAPNKHKGNLKPWFEYVQLKKNEKWVFGHWAALMGTCNNENIFALDTGCVWRNHLTMIRWQDKKLFIEKSHAR